MKFVKLGVLRYIGDACRLFFFFFFCNTVVLTYTRGTFYDDINERWRWLWQVDNDVISHVNQHVTISAALDGCCGIIIATIVVMVVSWSLCIACGTPEKKFIFYFGYFFQWRTRRIETRVKHYIILINLNLNKDTIIVIIIYFTHSFPAKTCEKMLVYLIK